MSPSASVPQLHSTVASFRQAVAGADGAVGFVPTMGYLHAGHQSLAASARADSANRLVVASIFVNPLQFAVNEDLAAYPRNLERDMELLGSVGVDHLFCPSVDEMYPWGTPMLTKVSVGTLGATMEGATRPTHFDGVATVVAKLFSIVGPCRAYFGEKDWQQLAIVRRMAADLSMPVTVIGCSTVREADGLAMSSRNVYLTDRERAAAPALHRALQAGVAEAAAGTTDPELVRQAMRRVFDDVVEAEVDYLEVVEAATMAKIDPLAGELRLLGAARFGAARLIDNVGTRISG